PRNGLPRRGFLRRHRHGRGARRRRHQVARRRAPGRRLRRGAGLPSGTGGGIAGCGRRPQPQHHGACRSCRPRRLGLGRPAGGLAPWQRSRAPGRRGGGMNAPGLAEVMLDADLIHDRDVLEDAIEDMADAIGTEYADDERPPLFVTIMNGGMPFATQLAFALGERGLDLEFDYLHATRYRGSTSGSRLAWLHRPATPMRGRRVILVDDILDEGHTLKSVTRWCEDEGAADIRVAVL